MFGELIVTQRNTYPIKDLVVFSKIKHQPDPQVRTQMTKALILSLRGNHKAAYEMFSEALEASRRAA